MTGRRLQASQMGLQRDLLFDLVERRPHLQRVPKKRIPDREKHS
jgi:hypothetical protein